MRCCEIGFTVGDRVWLCGYQHGYQDYQFEKIPRPPGEIELTRFRAQLFEPAEARNIHEDFYAKTVDPDNKDVWIQSTFRGELVGLLRARWGDKPKKGIVYEVSVRPDHRGMEQAGSSIDVLNKPPKLIAKIGSAIQRGFLRA